MLTYPFRSRFSLRCKPLALRADAGPLGIIGLLAITLWASTYRMATPAEGRINAPFAYSMFCKPDSRAFEIELNVQQQLSFNLERCEAATPALGHHLQAAAIQRLAAKHHLLITPQQLAQLASLSRISTGINQLVCGPCPGQPGIQASAGLSGPELLEWLATVRETSADLFQCPVYVDIRADARCGSSEVQRLLRTLQSAGVNRATFITQLR
jgi:hypothetical protein